MYCYGINGSFSAIFHKLSLSTPAPASEFGLFTSPAYLQPLEQTGCVSRSNGWMPQALRLNDIGELPCYARSNSWGEFVFDFQIARAYEQHGLDYYPKLVCCVPFTPVPGPRLLATNDRGKRALADALAQRAVEQNCSGAHILFLPKSEAALLTDEWLRRVQLRYVWRQSGGHDFENFLQVLPGKQRKNIRRERRAVAESGLTIQWQAAAETDEAEWPWLFELYASTYRMRGQEPYLNLACLRLWAQNFGERMQFCIARDHGSPVAMAFFFREGSSLYGRHWGADGQYNGLHFELCYYQGIEYCLAQGLTHFDAGVQGEHKQTRGFVPEFSHSAHWFADTRFRTAIRDFFAAEHRALSEQIAQ